MHVCIYTYMYVCVCVHTEIVWSIDWYAEFLPMSVFIQNWPVGPCYAQSTAGPSHAFHVLISSHRFFRHVEEFGCVGGTQSRFTVALLLVSRTIAQNSCHKNLSRPYNPKKNWNLTNVTVNPKKEPSASHHHFYFMNGKAYPQYRIQKATSSTSFAKPVVIIH